MDTRLGHQRHNALRRDFTLLSASGQGPLARPPRWEVSTEGVPESKGPTPRQHPSNFRFLRSPSPEFAYQFSTHLSLSEDE